MSRHGLPARRALTLAAVTATLALGALTAAGASTQAVDVQQQDSNNWAGYVAQSASGQSFSTVSGSWTEPSVSGGGGQGYSAFWVGLGGSSNQSQALEQVGTSAETVDGRTSYYAWYELVPAAQQRLDLAVKPGDHISARVTVNGTEVTVELSNATTGKSVSRTLPMSNPDVSSAEWIAEAPAAESSQGSLQVLPLADFGTVTFTDAAATTVGGHTGSISDPNWTVQQVQLGGEAAPGDLSTDGSSFAVSVSTGGYGPGQGAYGGYGYVDPGYGGGGYDPGYGAAALCTSSPAAALCTSCPAVARSSTDRAGGRAADSPSAGRRTQSGGGAPGAEGPACAREGRPDRRTAAAAPLAGVSPRPADALRTPVGVISPVAPLRGATRR